MRIDYWLMTVKILSDLVDGVALNEGVQHPELWLQKFAHGL